MTKDRIIFSHESARLYWLSGGTTLGAPPHHILVPSAANRVQSKKYVNHVYSLKIGANAIKSLDEKRAIVSPELCFGLMASSLSFPELVKLGVNLCASYYVEAGTQEIRKRECPICRPSGIQRFIEKTPGLRGQRNAYRSLKWVVPGSGSPMETVLYLLLCLPYAEGGYHLPVPLLNKRIDPPKKKSLAQQHWFVADLCWAERKVIVEYDGLNYHQDASRDKRRTNALEALGWKVFCLTKNEVLDSRSFDVAVRQIARTLGTRIRKPSGWGLKAQRLREELGLAAARAADC